MTEPHAFILAALALLFVPGPTNTLLAAGGAALGARGAMKLVVAELLGYAVSVCLLDCLVAPVAEAFSWLKLILRLVCAGYLAFVAWKLWRATAPTQHSVINFRRVFVATLCNPKALVFAFIILPPPSGENIALLKIYAPLLMVFIVVAGTCWVCAGAAIRVAAGVGGATLVRRASSVVLALFSATISFGAAIHPI